MKSSYGRVLLVEEDDDIAIVQAYRYRVYTVMHQLFQRDKRLLRSNRNAKAHRIWWADGIRRSDILGPRLASIGDQVRIIVLVGSQEIRRWLQATPMVPVRHKPRDRLQPRATQSPFYALPRQGIPQGFRLAISQNRVTDGLDHSGDVEFQRECLLAIG